MTPQLTVYKASAGSGKTFTLAKEYMTLVIDNPQSYRTILAVTFTNKATEEMKQRILSQLYGIHHQLPDSESYLEQIQQALPHRSRQQIVDNAGEALHLLLHNYSYFRVETIDTFFQSVLRNLARELDLSANLRVELNDKQVVQQAVDALIEELTATDRMLGWIIGYIRENIDEEKTWNVIDAIKEFGENITKDFYKDNAEALGSRMEQKDFFGHYQQRLRKMLHDTKEEARQMGDRFFQTLQEAGLSVDDLYNKKRGVAGYFMKLQSGQFDDKIAATAAAQNALASPEAWVSKQQANEQNPVYQCVCSTLHPLLHQTEKRRQQLVRQNNSLLLTLANLNQLRLLSSIDRKVKDMNQDSNRFLLSDTQGLLHALIEDSDSPFIFEKIGTQLDHVMIDEFQDTSTKQWKNFKVLLKETMSRQEAGNLIVGDVKQSIYRWRSGDWQLLNNIEAQFPTAKDTIEVKTLATNYRSCRNIIDFNNAFFTEAALKEAEWLTDCAPEDIRQLTQAYADVCQQVPEGKPAEGYVRMDLLSTEDGTTDQMLQQTYETVSWLIDQGIEPAKIAVLVRQKTDIRQIADYFMAQEKTFPLMSDEAFRLDASQAVGVIIDALRLLAHPINDIVKATLCKFATTYLHTTRPVDTLVEQREEWLRTPLYELVERIFTDFQLGEIPAMQQQSAYICAFYDQLNAFLADNPGSIDAFLAEWDGTLHDKSIQSDSTDGIRLITIHKSKGLEFENVVMPFCNWEIEKDNSILWCTPTEEPYSQLPIVPVKLAARQLKQSVYADEYNHEHLQNVVDNLNLLYVAFTRASKRLYVIARHMAKQPENRRNNLMENIVDQVAQRLAAHTEAEGTSVPVSLERMPAPQDCEEAPQAAEGKKKKKEEKKTFESIRLEYGHPTIETKKKKKKAEGRPNVFTTQQENRDIALHVSTRMPEFRQSNKSRDFIEGDEEEEKQKAYIRTGTILHNIFSNIRTTQDIEPTLRQLEADGILYDDHTQRTDIENMIRKRLQSEKVREWFSPRWTLFNECTILSLKDGKVVEHRPDRVMTDGERMIVVDFKFGKPQPEHHEQVKGYMQLLRDMGHQQVEGYLWYVYPNKITQV